MTAHPNVLAVDTSSRILSVAVANQEASFEANIDGTPKHSEHLIDLVQL